jgi:hypothetical protein
MGDSSCEKTDAFVRAHFHYDCATGNFTRHSHKRRVGHRRKDGYIDIDITVFGVIHRFKAHRLAWFFHYGVWPTCVIDHINGDTSDNRIDNLRDVTHAVNAQNKALHGLGKGDIGISPCSENTWRAEIQVGESRISLGTWDSKEEARAAYITAVRLAHLGYTGR